MTILVMMTGPVKTSAAFSAAFCTVLGIQRFRPVKTGPACQAVVGPGRAGRRFSFVSAREAS
jgi:hypothetical protein